MKIDNLNIETPVFLAPMAGVSDYPYRQLIREMGVELLYTEMVSSKGYEYGNKRTAELIEFDKNEDGKIAVQIFGEDPEFMPRAASGISSEYNIDIIDINMGCPARKIVKNGAGSALMKDLDLAYQIIKSTVNSVDIPVTVKMRSGWDENNINAVELAKLAQEAGAAAAAVHGRTRSQFYKGKADWGIISRVARAVEIPVIANGDIFSAQDAGAVFKETNCDGIMIGRKAQGYPWIFREIIEYLNSGKLIEKPSYSEKIDMAIKHLKLAVEYYGENHGVPIMRKHISWYLKGLPNASEMKNKVNQISEGKCLIELLQNYKRKLKN
ncbi:MAG: tRNA dihydrouridine synthase DusB [Halanaerobium sp.]